MTLTSQFADAASQSSSWGNVASIVFLTVSMGLISLPLLMKDMKFPDANRPKMPDKAPRQQYLSELDYY